MRGFDLKSGIIGALSTACVALALGAGQERAVAPRYQISVGPTNSLFVLDHETGVVSSVVRSGTLTGQPWMIECQFSLNDALSRRGGPPSLPGLPECDSAFACRGSVARSFRQSCPSVQKNPLDSARQPHA